MYRSDLIKGRMSQLGKTLEMLKEETGLSIGTLSAMRNGSESIELRNLHKLGLALGLSLHELTAPPTEAEAELAAR
jgi:transcriptional regulator with XRE-family HTH domain